MKLQQIENTLYIIDGEKKYRVSDESFKSFKDYLHFERFRGDFPLHIERMIVNGLDITELKDRIEIRDNEAVLLPEKTWFKVTATMEEKKYTIEQIEKFFNEAEHESFNTNISLKEAFFRHFK